MEQLCKRRWPTSTSLCKRREPPKASARTTGEIEYIFMTHPGGLASLWNIETDQSLPQITHHSLFPFVTIILTITTWFEGKSWSRYRSRTAAAAIHLSLRLLISQIKQALSTMVLHYKTLLMMVDKAMEAMAKIQLNHLMGRVLFFNPTMVSHYKMAAELSKWETCCLRK